MHIKGTEKLRSKLPDYPGNKLFIYLPIMAFSFIGPLCLMIFLDLLPVLYSSNLILRSIGPFIVVISSLIFEATGIYLVSCIWSKKKRFLELSQERAYQMAFPYVVIGIPFFVVSMLHGFIPFDVFYAQLDESSLMWTMSKPLSYFVFGNADLTYIPRLLIGLGFLIFALGTVLRSLHTFGIDYMSVLYVYYPEESEVQNLEIYSIVRHPTYLGLFLMSFSFIFFRFSIFSIILCVMFIIGMNIHVKVVEEKELLQRFGASYEDYKKSTPAFFFHPKNFPKYIKFLIGQEN